MGIDRSDGDVSSFRIALLEVAAEEHLFDNSEETADGRSQARRVTHMKDLHAFRTNGPARCEEELSEQSSTVLPLCVAVTHHGQVQATSYPGH